MPSSVTGPLFDGESVSFPEFAARSARTVTPWIAYEREYPIGAPLPDNFESSSIEWREKTFREHAIELAEIVSWSPEEAEAQAHQANLGMLKSHLQIVRSSREKVARYEFMSAQVAAWQAPTEEHETMRTVMQEQLDETFGWYKENIYKLPPEKVTGEQYRQDIVSSLARFVIEHGSDLDRLNEQIDQDSEFASEFKASLEGWEEVPVPKRTLP